MHQLKLRKISIVPVNVFIRGRGQIKQGPQGIPGPRGVSIVGKQGVQGERGEQGEIGVGIPGPRGIQGDSIRGQQGQQGEIGPAPKHRWFGTALQFQNPDGTWGKQVNLKGDRGPNGGGVNWAGTIEAIGDLNVDYDTQMNVIDDFTSYIGDAVPGTATSSYLWRVQKVTTNAEGDLVRTWEGGSASFDKRWDDYASI